MKKLFVLLLAVLMLCCCACGKSEEVFPQVDYSQLDPDAPENTGPMPERGPTVSIQDLVTEEDTPDPAETEPPVSVVDTEYYTLTLPEEWIGKVLCDLHKKDDGTYNMSVHEIRDFLDFGGGKLFTVWIIPAGEDYTYFPIYDFLGVLDTPEGKYNLVVDYPSDVQSSEENRAVYMALNEQVEDVLRTVAPKDGVELAMP